MRNFLHPRRSGALRTLWRAISFAAVTGTAAFALACGDTNSLLSPAFVENVDRQYEMWAISGTPAALPSGYMFTSESQVRPQVLSGGSLNFDVAFDITADGKVLVLPARLVVPLPPGGAPPIGFQRWVAAYEQLQRAPTQGYVIDSVATLGVGETITVQLLNSGCVYGDPLYAKLTVDEIDVAQRRMLVRTLVNRNCGYRSLTTGLPKD